MFTFVLYIASIAWAIYKGIVSPPVQPESDSDMDSADSDSDFEKGSVPLKEKPKHKTRLLNSRTSNASSTSSLHVLESGQRTGDQGEEHRDGGLHQDMFEEVSLSPLRGEKRAAHSTLYHLAQLALGLLALSLSGYILSHSITTLAAESALSSTVLGTTLLSFATTLPEKLVSVMSGARGEPGIVVANTAGSNIFLVTLCAGVLYLAGDLASLKTSLTRFELGCMWLSSGVLFGIVMVGARRWLGWLLFAAYIAFIVCEFTMDRHVGV